MDDQNDIILNKQLERKAKLVKIIEAIDEITQNPAYRTLREEIFDGLQDSLEKKMFLEAKGDELRLPEIYRLQGKILLARKYLDFKKMGDEFRLELNNLNKLIG